MISSALVLPASVLYPCNISSNPSVNGIDDNVDNTDLGLLNLYNCLLPQPFNPVVANNFTFSAPASIAACLIEFIFSILNAAVALLPAFGFHNEDIL